jgi:hypothetical protein
VTQPTLFSVPQIVTLVVLAAIVIGWSVYLARRKGRLLAAMGPIAAGSLFAALAAWPRAEPVPGASGGGGPASTPGQAPAVVPGTATPLLPSNTGGSPSVVPQGITPAPAPRMVSGVPPTVVLAGRWTDEDAAVVRGALAGVLSRVPRAHGAELQVDGMGRILPTTSRGVQRYGITATWTLRAAPDSSVFAGGAMVEVAGVGATPDQARWDAARRVARDVATAVLALPDPR